MKPLVIFKFDKIVEICPKKIPLTMKEIYFRPLPNVRLFSNTEDLLTLVKDKGYKILLLAFENEIFVKEALYVLKICYYFDEILIIDEYCKDCSDSESFAKTLINDLYKSNFIYAHQPNINLFEYLV